MTDLKLDYSTVTRGDLDSLTHLYEEHLNSGEVVKDWLEKGLDEPDYIGVKCTDGRKIIGTITARPGVEFTCGHPELVEFVYNRCKGCRLYTVDMVVVCPEYRGCGIARELSERINHDLKKKGCDRLVIEQWRPKNDDNVPASGVLKYLGEADTIGSYAGFYQNITDYGMDCPICDKGSCECGAVISIIKIA